METNGQYNGVLIYACNLTLIIGLNSYTHTHTHPYISLKTLIVTKLAFLVGNLANGQQ